MFSLTLAQLVSSSVSNQESHPSLQGGHLLVFWFRLRKIKCYQYQQDPALEGKEHLTLFTEGLPAPVLAAQSLC